MESLYTKYRPQTFDDIVGQTSIVETLKRSVLEEKTSHAYLFCGPRGTGKTSMARLLAKALVTPHKTGEFFDPNTPDCQLIAKGEHPDVLELDAASRTGVDDVRGEIIERLHYAPVRGIAKVYIIDEVHMLTPAAFNALLKTLEEPPQGVTFIMCTTDPQKILDTVLSRIQRFDFHTISTKDLIQHLRFVCDQEGFEYEESALALIARHADGGMRDALTSLEQLSVFGAQHISDAVAQDFLGEVSTTVLQIFVTAIARRDTITLFSELAKLVAQGRDLVHFCQTLSAYVRDVYVAALADNLSEVLSRSSQELDELQQLVALFGAGSASEKILDQSLLDNKRLDQQLPDEKAAAQNLVASEYASNRIARVLTVLGDASNEMRSATNQRLCLEIAFVRAARPKSDLTLEALEERIGELETTIAEMRKDHALPASATTSAMSTATVDVTPVATSTAATRLSPAAVPGPETKSREVPVATEPRPVQKTAARTSPVASAAKARGAQAANAKADSAQTLDTKTGDAQTVDTKTVNEKAAKEQATKPTATDAKAAVQSAAALQRAWKELLNDLLANDPAKGSLLISSSLQADDGSTLTVSLPTGSSFAAKMLARNDIAQFITVAVSKKFGPRKVVYVESSLTTTTQIQHDRTEKQSNQRVEQQSVQQTEQRVEQQGVQHAEQYSETTFVPVEAVSVSAAPEPEPTAMPITEPAIQPNAPSYDLPWDDVSTNDDEDDDISRFEDYSYIDDESASFDDAFFDEGRYDEESEELASPGPTLEQKVDGAHAPQPLGHSAPLPEKARTSTKPATQNNTNSKAAKQFEQVIAMLTEAFGEPVTTTLEQRSDQEETSTDDE